MASYSQIPLEDYLYQQAMGSYVNDYTGATNPYEGMSKADAVAKYVSDVGPTLQRTMNRGDASTPENLFNNYFAQPVQNIQADGTDLGFGNSPDRVRLENGNVVIGNHDNDADWSNRLGGLLAMAPLAMTGAWAAGLGGAGAGSAAQLPFGEQALLAGAPGATAATGAASMPDWASLLEGTGISPEEMQALVGQAQGDISTGLAGSTGTASAGGASWMNQLQSLLNGGGIGGGLPTTPPGTSSVLQRLLSGGAGALGGLNGYGALGGLLGALAGGLGANQKPAGTTTSVQDIPDYLKPYQSMNLTSGVNNFGLAQQGSALLPGAMDQLGRTISGQYLDPNTNPAFQPYVKDLMGQALSTYTGQYGGPAGTNLNNTGNQEGAARAITNAALPLYNSAYQTERGNQVNAAGQAPAFASNFAGAALAPNLAFKNLYSGAQANTQPYFTNPGAGIFSGGLAGLTLGNAFGKG